MPWQVRDVVRSMKVDAAALAEVAPLMMAQIGSMSSVRASEARAKGPVWSVKRCGVVVASPAQEEAMCASY